MATSVIPKPLTLNDIENSLLIRQSIIVPSNQSKNLMALAPNALYLLAHASTAGHCAYLAFTGSASIVKLLPLDTSANSVFEVVSSTSTVIRGVNNSSYDLRFDIIKITV